MTRFGNFAIKEGDGVEQMVVDRDRLLYASFSLAIASLKAMTRDSFIEVVTLTTTIAKETKG